MQIKKLQSDSTSLIAKFLLFLVLHSEIVLPAFAVLQNVGFEISNDDFSSNVISLPNDIMHDRLLKDETIKKAIGRENVMTNLIVEQYFDHSEANIGVEANENYDSPADNLFVTKLENIDPKNKIYQIDFDLFGGLDYNSVPISINNSFISGNILFQENEEWTKQTLELDPSLLKNGYNYLYFTSLDNQKAKIKNLKLIIKSRIGSANLPLDGIKIVRFAENKLLVKANKVNGVEAVFVKELNYRFLGIKLDSVFEGKIVEDLKQLTFSAKVGGKELNLICKVEELEEREGLNSQSDKVRRLQKVITPVSKLDLANGFLVSSLNTIDLPQLHSNIINCTGEAVGIRIKSIAVQKIENRVIEVPFDPKKLPNQTNPKAITTFYFDKQIKKWVKCAMLNIDTKRNVTTVKSLGDGDYVNGIIKAPEASETSGYAPTTISGIKAADPLSEMTIVAPPEANNKGTANISYPIKIPAGRNGMQPSISLQYSNDGGNGILGQGWSLPISAVTLDTRWGVPTFDQQNESEMYNLDGEQLMHPRFEGSDYMPNRPHDVGTLISTSPQPRSQSQNTPFTFRKAVNQSKVERLGNSTHNYVWKVTSTNGVMNYYGGDENGVVENAIIRNSAGHITQWGLFKMVDLFGNNVKYFYQNMQLINQPKPALNGTTFFNVSEIRYTGSGSTDGKYSINFQYETQPVRNDIMISARESSLTSTPFRLEDIMVKYDGTTLRSYRMSYIEGAFAKSLLSGIAEKDLAGVVVNQHKFQYYNDLIDRKGDLQYFSNPEQFSLPSLSNPSPKFSLGSGNLFGYSKLNTNQAIELGYEARVSIGFQIKVPKTSSDENKTITLGTSFSESFPKNISVVSMTDIDGDGFEDFVYRSSDGLKYRSSYFDQTTNTLSYSNVKDINGASIFYRSEGYTKSKFFENFDVFFKFSKKKYNVGKNRFKSLIDNDVYLTDANADGLPDIIKDNVVLFNTIDRSTGQITFTPSSTNTENEIKTASVSEVPEVVHQEPDDNQKPDAFDPIRIWVAPKDGQITISDNVILTNAQDDTAAMYSIETATQSLNGGIPFRLFLKNLNQTTSNVAVNIATYGGNNPSLGLNSSQVLTVIKGQIILFRVSSKSAKSPLVSLNPQVTFVNETLFDESNNNVTSSSYSNAFLLSDGSDYVIKKSGSVQIGWSAITFGTGTTPMASDRITYRIVVEKESDTQSSSIEIFRRTIDPNAVATMSVSTNSASWDIVNPLPITISDSTERARLRFEVLSQSGQNWKAIEWRPHVRFFL